VAYPQPLHLTALSVFIRYYGSGVSADKKWWAGWMPLGAGAVAVGVAGTAGVVAAVAFWARTAGKFKSSARRKTGTQE